MTLDAEQAPLLSKVERELRPGRCAEVRTLILWHRHLPFGIEPASPELPVKLEPLFYNFPDAAALRGSSLTLPSWSYVLRHGFQHACMLTKAQAGAHFHLGALPEASVRKPSWPWARLPVHASVFYTHRIPCLKDKCTGVHTHTHTRNSKRGQIMMERHGDTVAVGNLSLLGNGQILVTPQKY